VRKARTVSSAGHDGRQANIEQSARVDLQSCSIYQPAAEATMCRRSAPKAPPDSMAGSGPAVARRRESFIAANSD